MKFSYRVAIRFYVPLVIQAAAQSLTYPLVARVITHDGDVGVRHYSAYAQALAVMFVFNAVCGALLTTGMVFGKTRTGYERSRRLTYLLCFVSCLAQALCSMTSLREAVFGGFLKLPPEEVEVAGRVLLYVIPANIAFFIRNNYCAVLYNAMASAMANAATLGRIAVTVLVSWFFVRYLGYTGYAAGCVAFCAPALLECVVVGFLARPYIRRLPAGNTAQETFREQVVFTLSLAFGG
ncbi:MAG: hypothetical protein FWF84_08030, partial [Kiritimatiellaeota bacterium]|nr:hypothetical protein [Kiritimatiellota bacterium]